MSVPIEKDTIEYHSYLPCHSKNSSNYARHLEVERRIHNLWINRVPNLMFRGFGIEYTHIYI